MQGNHLEEQTPDEATLVQSAMNCDATAFGRLYAMHMDRVYRHIYYRVANQADAEDLTQQVFSNAWQSIGRYRRTGSPFIAWLMTIGHNLAVNLLRAKKGRAYLEAEVLADDSALGPELSAEAGFEEQRLRRAILQLRPDEQQVVTLRFMEGFEFAEIAALLDKKEGNIRVILHRALVRLRNTIEKEGTER